MFVPGTPNDESQHSEEPRQSGRKGTIRGMDAGLETAKPKDDVSDSKEDENIFANIDVDDVVRNHYKGLSHPAASGAVTSSNQSPHSSVQKRMSRVSSMAVLCYPMANFVASRRAPQPLLINSNAVHRTQSQAL